MPKRYPFFWYFATPFNSEFFFLSLLIDEKDYTIATIPSARKFHIKTDNDKIVNMIKVMGLNLNIFGDEIDDIHGAIESLKAWSEKIMIAVGIK